MFDKINIKKHIESIENMTGYRIVEDQQYISTRPLVDNDLEHEILEELLENNKPKKPFKMSDAAKSDYLLFTAFRYPPLKSGTRFGKITERSIFYGCKDIEGAFSEIAHMRFCFLDDSYAKLPLVTINYTSFRFTVKSDYFVDLSKGDFLEHKNILTNKNDYSQTQKLGTSLKKNNVEVFSYFSARKENSINIAIIDPCVFSKRTTNIQNWRCSSDKNNVEFSQARKIKYKFSR